VGKSGGKDSGAHFLPKIKGCDVSRWYTYQSG
jgi:hypothetical protein